MPLKKRYLKSKPVCKVTFKVTKEAADGAKKVALVGDFNNWEENEIILKKMKNGDFSIVVDLPKDKEFQYRYLYDNEDWKNDWNADFYVSTNYPGTENSVVKT